MSTRANKPVMESHEPFFNLTPEEASGIAIYCIECIDDLRKSDKLPPPLSNDTFMESLHSIKEKILAVTGEDSDNIFLNKPEALTLQIVIAYTLQFFNTYIQSLDPQQEPNEGDDAIREAFEYLKEESPVIMVRLTRAFEYNTVGIEALEGILGIKTGAVRPLNVDNTEIVSKIVIDHVNSTLISFMFNIIDVLEDYKDDYSFAKKLYSNQFLNMTDYKRVRDKVLPLVKPNSEIQLTMFDTIVMYWVSSVTQRAFVSDAADIFDNRNNLSHETFKKVRQLFLQYNDLLITEMKERLGTDETFKHYTEQVNNWKFEV